MWWVEAFNSMESNWEVKRLFTWPKLIYFSQFLVWHLQLYLWVIQHFHFVVYCPFPGYIQNGRVMLVGNMGVYDYRPYVRKVTNNKQIMYECDRGYVLNDGPSGATCIGGRWSPKQLPR